MQNKSTAHAHSHRMFADRLRQKRYAHVLGGDLVKAVDQLGDKVVIPAGQETVDLLCDPPIVQQALSGGGRKRGRQG